MVRLRMETFERFFDAVRKDNDIVRSTVDLEAIISNRGPYAQCGRDVSGRLPVFNGLQTILVNQLKFR
jgi:hypothetical protein